MFLLAFREWNLFQTAGLDRARRGCCMVPV